MQITKIIQITVLTIDAKGGRGKIWQLFGENMNTIIEELNEELVA